MPSGFDFSRSAEEMEELFDKAESSEMFTAQEKRKLSELESYDDTEIRADISEIKAEEVAQSSNISANSAAIAKLTKALGGLSLVKCTQSEYDAMETHDADTVYIIAG